MVQAIIDIKPETNQTLNIVKAKFNLRDKSQAINMMAEIYQNELLEPELRPEYIQEAKEISKGKKIKVGTIEEFKRRYE
jgi:RNase P subunit RPR2